MKMAKHILGVGISLLLMFVILSCEGKQEEVTRVEKPPVAVKVQVVSLTNEVKTKTFTGTLEGERQAVIYAKIAEAVDRVHVREGDRVREGQILISLDKTGPSSHYQEAMSVFRNAEKNYKKMKFLYEEGAVSETQFDEAKTQYEVAKANFEAAEKLVEIESPIDGIVTFLNVSRGDYLTPGQKLATVATVDTLRVKFGVNVSDVSAVHIGDTVVISSDAVRQKAYGTISSVARSADPVTRSFQVEARLINTSGLFTPGMFVRIEVVLERLPDVIAIPRGAVLNYDEKKIVYVVSDAIAHRREVRLGDDVGEKVVITHGLSVGDTVVTLGQDYLDDGVKVNVTEAAAGE